jgi:hypothetical protein
MYIGSYGEGWLTEFRKEKAVSGYNETAFSSSGLFFSYRLQAE